MKKRTAIAVLAIGLGLWMIKENKQVRITEYEVMSSKIPVSASGFTIVHISDFHNTLIGDNNRGLVEKIKDCQPDIIAVTGDLIDSRNTKVDVAISFIDALKEIDRFFMSQEITKAVCRNMLSLKRNYLRWESQC